MPQNPILMREKASGLLTYMHTVDAAEGARYHDYEPIPPGEEVSPEERASAMSRFKTGQAATHPELQTDEEKEETRRKANEEAELLAGLPPGTPIVVQAPSDRPASRSAQEAQQRQERQRQEREQRERQEHEHQTQAQTPPPASSGTPPPSAAPAPTPPTSPPVPPEAVRPRRP